jgi:hypothetical protein
MTLYTPACLFLPGGGPLRAIATHTPTIRAAMGLLRAEAN